MCQITNKAKGKQKIRQQISAKCTKTLEHTYYITNKVRDKQKAMQQINV